MAIVTPTNFETLTYNMPNWSSILNTNWENLNTYMTTFEILWDKSATDGIKWDSVNLKWVSSKSGDTVQANLDTHTADTNNPHSVTTTQIGAATETDLTNHTTDTNNPHSVTKDQVGLGNVENVKVNLAATVAPTVTDDSDAGYSVGSLWIYNNTVYICVDNTAGAAVWNVYLKSSDSATITGDWEFTSSIIKFSNLPTADPLVAGQLWNNSGVVTVSSG